MAELPTGTVTFLFSDLESSTRLWEEHTEAMKGALARHDAILRDAVEAHGGRVLKSTGDGLLAVFETAHAAAVAAAGGQLTLAEERWGTVGPLRVRMGLHTGEAESRAGDYYGPVLNRAARLTAAAYGGQILVTHATEAVLRDHLGEDLGLVDLGEHRLRDLSRPEHAFQLRAPGLTQEFPPLRSLQAFPGNLPLQLTSFIGRGDELAAIGRLLSESRLVTLTGVGGVGKTRLATQAAAQVLPAYRDGAWLCELAAATDGVALVEVVAAELGVSSRADVSLAGSVCDFLRTKQVLLVLDNCEHLLDAAGRFAGDVLRECSGVRILATSREGLGIAGERVWPLRSLPVPEPSAGHESMVASDAVRLFAERAQAARSGFAIDAMNAGMVVEICRRLDGVPLALELAAARVVAMSPADISARLEERFRLLTGGRRTAAERHQTLRATVDWSYELLEPTERLVFDRLGVFAGSFDATAAEAIAAGDEIAAWDALDALASLVAKSMVVLEETPDGGVRYALLETLRQYARERLDEASDTDTWRRRHAEHYAGLAKTIGPALNGPDELMWRHKLHAELDNLRSAVNWALDSDTDDVGLAVRIVAALANESHLHRASGIGTWAERAVSQAAAATAGQRTAVLGAAAQSAIGRGDIQFARSLALDALRDGLPADCPAPSTAYIALATTDAYTGRPDEALRVMSAARNALNAIEDGLFDRAALHTRAAVFHAWLQELVEARAEAEEALRLARQLGNPSTLAYALYALGWALGNEEPDAALAALDESIALTARGASDGAFGGALVRVAQLRAQAGSAAAALEALREAIAHSHSIGYRRAAVYALGCGVEVLATLGHTEPAAVLGAALTVGPLAPPAPIASDFDHIQQMLQAELGLESYQAAATRGAAMTYDEALEYILSELDQILMPT